MTQGSLYQKKWREKNKEKWKLWRRNYYLKNKDKIQESNLKWRIKNYDHWKKKNWEYRQKTIKKLREAIFKRYEAHCNNCNFSDWRALQIDHINGGGNEHRRQSKDAIPYLKSILNDKKELFQILCANCNRIKEYE